MFAIYLLCTIYKRKNVFFYILLDRVQGMKSALGVNDTSQGPAFKFAYYSPKSIKRDNLYLQYKY